MELLLLLFAQVSNLLMKMCYSKPFADDELEKFIGEVLKASSRGISALRNATSEPNWTFGQALFFSTTVVTTIGLLTLTQIFFCAYINF